jgi:DNA-binding transcriptional MerR regulator
MGGKAWKTEELDTLQELAGDVPWPQLTRLYNLSMGQRGYTTRTETAIRRKCNELGLRVACQGEWVNAGFVCKLLGISYESVRGWIIRGWLPAKRFGDTRGNRYYFTRSDLRKLAKARPRLFGGYDVAVLTQLLDDEHTAEWIADQQLPRLFQPRTVICIETGKRYKSISAAARDVYVVPKCIFEALDRPNKTSAGYHWRSDPPRTPRSRAAA